MPSLPFEMIVVLAPFAQLFSARVWQHVQVLVTGALLAPGQRTVSSCLRVMGLSGETHFTNSHRGLNRAAWAAVPASKILLGLLLRVLVPPGATIVLGADDPVERRSGRHIKATGCYRAAVRSSRKHIVKCFGVQWVARMRLVPVPWSTRVWALPFVTALCWPAKSRPKRRHKTRVDWVRQLVKQTRRWLPGRLLVLVVDGGFAAVALAWAGVGTHVTRVARLRLDAVLPHPPTPPPPGRRGRKPTKGKRQRRVNLWAARTDTPGQDTTVDWYRGERKRLRVFSRTALWYTPGLAPVALRFVVVRDPAGHLADTAFCCTDLSASPEQILHGVVLRWSLEVTFEEARAPLGLETQRQWTDLAIARTTPVRLGLCSLVTVLAAHFCPSGQIPIVGSAWYRKPEAPFADCLAWVRPRLWGARYLATSAPQADFVQLPREVFDLLLTDLPLAA